MNAIGHPLVIQRSVREALHPDARSELAHHYFDLRIHALVMLSTAILAAYCGYRILDGGGAATSDDLANIVMPGDVLSIAGATVFVVISALCLVQAHSAWRKAAVAVVRNALSDDALRRLAFRVSRKS